MEEVADGAHGVGDSVGAVAVAPAIGGVGGADKFADAALAVDEDEVAGVGDVHHALGVCGGGADVELEGACDEAGEVVGGASEEGPAGEVEVELVGVAVGTVVGVDVGVEKTIGISFLPASWNVSTKASRSETALKSTP